MWLVDVMYGRLVAGPGFVDGTRCTICQMNVSAADWTGPCGCWGGP